MFLSAECLYFLSVSPGELWPLTTLCTVFLLGNLSLYKAVNAGYFNDHKAFTF